MARFPVRFNSDIDKHTKVNFKFTSCCYGPTMKTYTDCKVPCRWSQIPLTTNDLHNTIANEVALWLKNDYTPSLQLKLWSRVAIARDKVMKIKQILRAIRPAEQLLAPAEQLLAAARQTDHEDDRRQRRTTNTRQQHRL